MVRVYAAQMRARQGKASAQERTAEKVHLQHHLRLLGYAGVVPTDTGVMHRPKQTPEQSCSMTRMVRSAVAILRVRPSCQN
eukprot:11318921-Alexandrium_andersonii.AAC.1